MKKYSNFSDNNSAFNERLVGMLAATIGLLVVIGFFLVKAIHFLF